MMYSVLRYSSTRACHGYYFRGTLMTLITGISVNFGMLMMRITGISVNFGMLTMLITGISVKLGTLIR